MNRCDLAVVQEGSHIMFAFATITVALSKNEGLKVVGWLWIEQLQHEAIMLCVDQLRFGTLLPNCQMPRQELRNAVCHLTSCLLKMPWLPTTFDVHVLVRPV